MNKVLVLILSLFLLLIPSQALAQDKPMVTVDDQACGRIRAMITNVPAGATVRFQLGHDLVKRVQVTEQDTAATFDSGPFPASDWGFSVRILQGGDDTTVLDRIVTVTPCPTAVLPFTGIKIPFIPGLLFGMVLVLSGIVVVLLTRRIQQN